MCPTGTKNKILQRTLLQLHLRVHHIRRPTGMSRDLSAQAALFAKEYRSSSTSEMAKEETKWKILRWAFKLSPFQNVSEMMNNIQEALEQAPAVVLELQEKDIVVGRRSIPYRQRVFMFVEEYCNAVG